MTTSSRIDVHKTFRLEPIPQNCLEESSRTSGIPCHGHLDQYRCQPEDTISKQATWTAALQWVQSHVGVPSNERADPKAKQGAESTQPEVPLTLRRATSIISTYIDQYTAMTQKTKSFEKQWETLATVDPIPRHMERTEAVSCFCLTTGHDFFGSIPPLAWHGC
ncbi:reverse transcriptase [Trichonephila clavipes]|nr:reverse transcriptase [Trichonephila clavipes]